MKDAFTVLRLSNELKTKSIKAADKKELSLSSWIRIAIIDKLKREKNE